MSIRVDDGILAAVEEQQSRGLHRSAAWLSEMAIAATPAFLASSMTPPAVAVPPPALTMGEQLRARHALSLLTQHEYLRCGRLLLSSGASLHPKLTFLGCYALYLAGEKAATIERASSKAAAEGAAAATSASAVGVVIHSAAAAQLPKQTNPHLGEVADTLSAALDAFPNDAYMLWLHGVTLQALGNRRLAKACFIGAVSVEPLLRCAWEDLAKCTTGATQLAEVLGVLGVPPDAPFGDAFMADLFAAATRSQYLGPSNEVAAEWDAPQRHFPNSTYIHCQLGAALSSRRDFDGCRQHYEAARALDPHRLDGMDDYSNALFVKRDRLALGLLAEHCYGVDPFRAESNIVAGNYYAIVRRHERSLQHFKRAVAIDPTAVSAWTLMGHEFLEVKNANAAVSAYRAAIAVGPSDYRPWYGLGQIYELLQVYHYALHYYWQTTTLRPNDPRMWAAVAGCLERQDRVAEAMACLERAEAADRSGEQYPQRARRLAQHYRGVPGGDAKATVFYERLVQSPFAAAADLLEALPYLVEHFTQRACALLALPSRSPSFESAAAVLMPRPLGAAHYDEAVNAVGIAESYLGRLQQLADHDDNEASAVAAVIPSHERPERIAGVVARLAADLDVAKVALRLK